MFLFYFISSYLKYFKVKGVGVYDDNHKSVLRREYEVILKNIEKFGENGVGYDRIFLDKYEDFLKSDDGCIQLYNEHLERLTGSKYHVQALIAITCGLLLIGCLTYIFLNNHF